MPNFMVLSFEWAFQNFKEIGLRYNPRRHHTPRISGGQITLCNCTWKRTGSASATIRSTKSLRVMGVKSAGTFFSDLSCCCGANGATQENNNGQTAERLCFAIISFAHS